MEQVLKEPHHTLDGKRIDPKYATPKNRPKTPNRTKKIFVGGVSQDTTAEEVKAFFSQFGKVEDATMLMDQQTKRHRGFGFVTFENEDVVEIVCEIHYHTIKNKKVECKKAMPKDSLQNVQLLGKRIMMNGLPVQITPQTARALATATVNPLTLPTNHLAHAQAAQAAAVAAAQAQIAAVAGYGKTFSTYPPLTTASYRYSPYPLAAATVNQASMGSVNPGGNPNPGAPQPTAGPQLAPPGAVPATAYQGYNLANVDMSSFQGVDWTSMYPWL